MQRSPAESDASWDGFLICFYTGSRKDGQAIVTIRLQPPTVPVSLPDVPFGNNLMETALHPASATRLDAASPRMAGKFDGLEYADYCVSGPVLMWGNTNAGWTCLTR